jgi:hypothetical protein
MALPGIIMDLPGIHQGSPRDPSWLSWGSIMALSLIHEP